MLLLLADEHIDPALVRGLQAREPTLDVIRVHDVGLLSTPDPDILVWAATAGRVLFTHDRNTMPDFAYERIRAGEPMPGVIVVSDRLPLGQAIQELLIFAVCCTPDELQDQVAYIPM